MCCCLLRCRSFSSLQRTEKGRKTREIEISISEHSVGDFDAATGESRQGKSWINDCRSVHVRCIFNYENEESRVINSLRSHIDFQFSFFFFFSATGLVIPLASGSILREFVYSGATPRHVFISFVSRLVNLK